MKNDVINEDIVMDTHKGHKWVNKNGEHIISYPDGKKAFKGNHFRRCYVFRKL